jgi:hypothetical protein
VCVHGWCLPGGKDALQARVVELFLHQTVGHQAHAGTHEQQLAQHRHAVDVDVAVHRQAACLGRAALALQDDFTDGGVGVERDQSALREIAGPEHPGRLRQVGGAGVQTPGQRHQAP